MITPHSFCCLIELWRTYALAEFNFSKPDEWTRWKRQYRTTSGLSGKDDLIQNSPAIKKCAVPKNAVVKKDVKSKVVAKKWL